MVGKVLAKTRERQRVVCNPAEQKREYAQYEDEPQRIGEEIGERLECVPTSWNVIEEACQKHA
jgi:hypothetical protein